MTNTSTPSFNRRDAVRRPSLPARGTNPFRAVPMPIPLEGWGLRAVDIFQARSLAHRLDMNAGWLQARPRTSDEIEAALFPEYSLGGMDHDEVRELMNHGIFDAGYTPDWEDSDNPTWTWNEGN